MSAEASLEQARREIHVEAITRDPILTIDDAITQKRFIGPAHRIRRGDPMAAIGDSPHTLRGIFLCGGQKQFYLKSQAALAYPDEQGRLVVYSSTQNPTEIQAVVAEVLRLGKHEVVCI